MQNLNIGEKLRFAENGKQGLEVLQSGPFDLAIIDWNMPIKSGIALLQDQFFLARFCFTIVGALFGFLWFNVHPAELFMGDTGSLAIGATLATFALMTGQWLVLPIIAIIPVSEIISVILQIIYFGG